MPAVGVSAEPASPERLPWSTGMAPAYIGTFLWVAFFDRIGERALPIGGLGPALLGVLAGAVLAYFLLYRVPASRGFVTGRSLDELAGGTFGTWGTLIVPNLVIGLAQVVLFAVGIEVATNFTISGLMALRTIDSAVVRPIVWHGMTVPAPVSLVTSGVWATVVALVGLQIVRWIAAIMQYFPIFPAIALAMVAAGTFTGLLTFRPSGIDPATGLTVVGDQGIRLAFLTTFQWTFAFAALPGITGADWGAASLNLADVRKGGWFGMAFAPTVIASLALLAIAGQEGRMQERAAPTAPDDFGKATPAIARKLGPGPRVPARPVSPLEATSLARIQPIAASTPLTFRSAIEGGLDRRLAALVLITFGLASLAPACYAAHEFGRRLARVGPWFSKTGWTLLGVVVGWLLIVGGWSSRTDLIFTILGALFAPVAGALVADSTRNASFESFGPRPRINLVGILAWVLGVGVGLAPLIASGVHFEPMARVPAAALLAFAVAFLTAFGLSRIGLGPKPAKIEDQDL